MGSRGAATVVSKTVKKLVEQVVKDFEEVDAVLAALNTSQEGDELPAENEDRRPSRVRKQPDRLVVVASSTTTRRVNNKRKQEEQPPEFLMAPPPDDLRGILKAPREYPIQPRKSSLTATAGKSIVKKYRRVRVSRKLKYKVIPALPGWRADHTRMPEDVPDEEEQARLDEKARQEEADEKKANARRRKRKSIGVAPLSSVSDEDTVAGGDDEEIESDAVFGTPGSPELYYEGFIKDGTPDSVLVTDDSEDEKSLTMSKHVAIRLFPTPNDKRGDAKEDTVAQKTDTVGGDTVDQEPTEARKRVERRRSVRIQALEERRKTMVGEVKEKERSMNEDEEIDPVVEQQAKVDKDKRNRRQSKVFHLTPMKESPVAAATKPVETKRERRKSMGPVVKKKEEQDAPSKPSTSRNPYNDAPCRSEEERARQAQINEKRRKNKVSNWLEKSESAEDVAHREDTSLVLAPLFATRPAEKGEVIESSRASEAAESHVAELPASSLLIEKGSSSQLPKRTGRRSMKVDRREEEVGGAKENEESSSKKISKNKSEEANKVEEKKKQHPFFRQFAPKSTPAVGATVVPTESAAPAKKSTRRRSMFAPKKSAREEEEEEEESGIEIVGEVKSVDKKEEDKKDDATAVPTGDFAAAVWRSSEIDAAPFEGLMHSGWEGDHEKEKEGEEGEVGPLLKKMRRLSTEQPRLSSYNIPPSMMRREDDSAADKTMFFEEEGEKELSKRGLAYAGRARDLTGRADGTLSWAESIRPRTVDECIGDKEVLQSGRKWLQRWKKRLDAAAAEEEKPTKEPKVKRKRRRGGNYSDESEQEDSDPDYELWEEEERRLPNPLVLSGPIGCGKTAYVHALASEVGFSILESAPDERRTGAALRTKLSGAVANYRMSSKSNGIASFFAARASGDASKEEEDRKRKEKENERRKHTLVVIEHVDVVFTEEDKLFWPALAEILATTKIPIVLTCNAVPAELTRVLRQAEESGGEAREMRMEREEGRAMEEYVEASLLGAFGRRPTPTVISSFAARARRDLRATLNDAHWAAAGDASIDKADFVCMGARRVDEPTACDAAVVLSFAWTDECERRAAARSDAGELHRVTQWPQRCAIPRSEDDVYKRICHEIDNVDEEKCRDGQKLWEERMEMARSGIFTGHKGHSCMLTRREIAMDWMPILVKIDDKERLKKSENRRHQHYFNVIDMGTGRSIDPLDEIQRACSFFKLS
ncbi:hypothetical protein PFISCL1PPCAC_22912 [Pristionchus fissidentatus]|uniref:ATPase AAA-type core domain-containing protein n=1 Tax=Pristionchus fissidentatus TaxID=1538716 RepID=A0AAV5WM01_9BILA|nr:hypothetical protein PFISCL1PPCAC_22912 [Pristionchus fissidentatus]